MWKLNKRKQRKTMEKEKTKKKMGLLGMLLDSLGAGVLEVMLVGKGVILTDKKIIRERENF